MNVYEEIKEALVRLFKGLFPAFDVSCETLAKTDNHGQGTDLEDYIFLDIIPAASQTAGEWHTDRSVFVDAAIHTRSEKNRDYLAMTGTIDRALRPVFRFSDRAVTVPGISFRVVDRLLHCTFTLAFRDSTEEPEPLPMMGELELTVKQERA